MATAPDLRSLLLPLRLASAGTPVSAAGSSPACAEETSLVGKGGLMLEKRAFEESLWHTREPRRATGVMWE